MKTYVIPPIIQNWIEQLRDTHQNMSTRENIAMMLDNVRMACTEEVSRFRKHVETKNTYKKRR